MSGIYIGVLGIIVMLVIIAFGLNHEIRINRDKLDELLSNESKKKEVKDGEL